MLKWWSHIKSINPILAKGTLFHLLLLLVLLFIWPFDDREVLGLNVWVKPIKFSLSIILFLLTTVFLLDALPFSARKTRILSRVMLGCMLFEIACIVLQSARGERSHFNDTDALGSALFPLMGTAISIIVVIYAVFFVNYLYMDVKLTPAMKWAVRCGMFIFLMGAVSGFTMANNMQHAVGGADGGPGLPFTNWSTVTGDLRVSHFISLHALQIFPLMALILVKKIRLPEHKVIRILLIVAVLYFSFDVFAFIQAMHGQPFIEL